MPFLYNEYLGAYYHHGPRRKRFGRARPAAGMVIADLHVHTTSSDGAMALDEVPGAARRAGVGVVAITDHDRLHPGLSTPVTRRGGVTVVRGIELRVEADGQRVDLLGYGARHTAALESLVERLQTDRMERGRDIADCVAEELGVDLDLTVGPGLGRPHVARAAADASDRTYQEVFDELIHDGGPCYEARDVPSFDEGRSILAEACGLVGLAHPLRYDDTGAALSLCADLDAVEGHYPYERGVDTRPVERAARDHDLVVTGGSDAHDDELGRAGLDRDGYRRFRSRLSLP